MGSEKVTAQVVDYTVKARAEDMKAQDPEQIRMHAREYRLILAPVVVDRAPAARLPCPEFQYRAEARSHCLVLERPEAKRLPFLDGRRRMGTSDQELP